MKKLSSMWVPCLVTVNQKKYIDDSECCLELFKQNKDSLCQCVTMDETRIYYIPKSKWITTEWTADGENHPSKTQNIHQ